MKRSIVLQSIIGVCMLSLVLSCHKRGEFEVPCKLLKIAHADRTGLYPYDNYAGYLTYTSWGDPARITWDLKSTGRPDYVFKYDHKRRLTEFNGMFDGTVFDFVTRYIYDASNKIVADTFWYSGQDVNNFRESAYGYIVNHYTYDSKGRIIRIDSQNNFGHPPYFTTYAYDAAGNKVRQGAVYDNKKSYLRTNAWLMFITRDFSVNNYKVADEYNKKGLPLTYNSTVLTFMNSLVNEFDYNCDYKNH